MKLPNGTYHFTADDPPGPPMSWTAEVSDDGDTMATSAYGILTYNEEGGYYESSVPPEFHLYVFPEAYVLIAVLGDPPPQVGSWGTP